MWFLQIALAAQAGVVDRVAAVVNDDVLTLSEVYQLGEDFLVKRCPDRDAACVAPAELEVLDALIRRSLISQELTRLEIQVTAADVDKAIDRTVQQYQLADRAALRSEVEATGKRWDQYRQELLEVMRTNAFQGRVLAPRITVNDDEVRDFYQRAARKVLTRVANVHGLGIPVPDGLAVEDMAALTLQASRLVDQINTGAISWEEAVEKHDGAGVSRMLTGKAFSPGELLAEIDQVVFAAEAGVVQQPRRIGDVLFVVRVASFDEVSEVAPIEEIKEQLTEQLFQEKLIEAEEEWYQRARREAAIDVKLAVP